MFSSTSNVRSGPNRAPQERLVGNVASFMAAQAAVTGGTVGRPAPVSSTMLPTCEVSKQDSAEFSYDGSVVVLSPSDVSNSDNSLTVLLKAKSVGNMPPSLQTLGPQYTDANVGFFPSNAPSASSYDVAANFGTIGSFGSKLNIKATRVAAGANDIEGTITTCVLAEKPDLDQLNKSAFWGLASGSEHYRNTAINVPHTAFQSGSNKLFLNAGNAVDSRGGTRVYSKNEVITLTRNNVTDFVGWSGRNGGRMQEYYDGAVDVSINISANMDSLQLLDQTSSIFVRPQFYYANVDPTTGEVVITTVTMPPIAIQESSPSILPEQTVDGYARIPNPTNVGGAQGYPSYLIGYTLPISWLTSGPDSPATELEADVTVTIKYHSQSPEGSGPAVVSLIEGYNGPLDVSKESVFFGVPDNERYRDYKNSMSMPTTSAVSDAVRTAVYSVFHTAQGIVLCGQTEVNQYLMIISSPSAFMKLIAHGSQHQTHVNQSLQVAAETPYVEPEDEYALNDAGLLPMLQASQFAKYAHNSPQYKAGLFTFLKSMVGNLAKGFKAVTDVASHPATKAIADGVNRIANKDFTSYKGASALDNMIEDRYRASGRYQSAPRYESASFPGDTPRTTRSNSEVEMSQTPKLPDIPDKPKYAPEFSKDEEFLTNLRNFELAYEARHYDDVPGFELPFELRFSESMFEPEDYGEPLYYSAGANRTTGDFAVVVDELVSEVSRTKMTTENKVMALNALTDILDSTDRFVKACKSPVKIYKAAEFEAVKLPPVLTFPKKKEGHLTIKDVLKRMSEKRKERLHSLRAASIEVGANGSPHFCEERCELKTVPKPDITPNKRCLKYSSACARNSAMTQQDRKQAAQSMGLKVYEAMRSSSGFDDLNFDLSDSDDEVVQVASDDLLPQDVKSEMEDMEFDFSNFKPVDVLRLDDTQKEQITRTRRNNYLTGVTATGAGPAASSRPAKRLAQVRATQVRPVLPAVSLFPLITTVGNKKEAHIAQLVVSRVPIGRNDSLIDPTVKPNASDHNRLYASYHEAVNITPGISVRFDKVFDDKGMHAAANAIKSASQKYAPNVDMRNIFISVVVSGDNTIPPNAVTGDSFALALYVAMLGLPRGPVLTGSVDENANLKRIGEINPKLTTAMKALRGTRDSPLFFPKDSLSQESYEKGAPKEAHVFKNTGFFEGSANIGIVPVDTLNDVVFWYTCGGYDLWHLTNVDAELQRQCDDIERYRAAGQQQRDLIIKYRLIEQELKGATGDERAAIKDNLKKIAKMIKDLNDRSAPAETPEGGDIAEQKQKAKAKVKAQKAKVTSPGSKMSFIMKDGTHTDHYQGGKQQGAKNRWAIENLQGELIKIKEKTKKGEINTTAYFVPKVVPSNKAQTKKAKNEKAIKDSYGFDVNTLFDQD